RLPLEQFQLVSKAFYQGPTHPTLRANPFPEVTDIFCRLPLSTNHWLTLTHLLCGDIVLL
ncbi:hypothetical protein F5876DRAFT_21282, partial [Lentinula aff. lateritia]